MIHKKHKPGSSYLVWPVAILFFLTIGVFLTTREVPKQQESRTQAQVSTPTPIVPSGQATPTEIPPTNTPTDVPPPKGGLISLSFALPGISSQGGNIKPLRTTRTVAIAFYNRDDNILDMTVKPVYVAQAPASFDFDPSSPTYTSFVVKYFDLGSDLSNGDYQIALKANQTMQKILKTRESDIGGKVYNINNAAVLDIAFQTLIIGDIIPSPQGDNQVDIADYNAFIDCFGSKQNSSSCVAKEGADFDDNGIVDGIDYNIMIRSFQSLLALGFSVPKLVPSQHLTASPTPVKPSVTKTPAKLSLNPLGVVFTGIVIIWLISSAVVFLKSKRAKVKKEKVIEPGSKSKATPADSSASSSTEIEGKEYYIKKQTEDDTKKGVWMTLTDDNGPHLGHYSGTDVKEGFAHIKGTMKKEKDKTFIEVSKIISDEKK